MTASTIPASILTPASPSPSPSPSNGRHRPSLSLAEATMPATASGALKPPLEIVVEPEDLAGPCAKRVSSMEDSGTLFFDRLDQRFLYPSLTSLLDGTAKQDRVPAPPARRSTMSSKSSSVTARTARSLPYGMSNSSCSLSVDDFRAEPCVDPADVDANDIVRGSSADEVPTAALHAAAPAIPEETERQTAHFRTFFLSSHSRTGKDCSSEPPRQPVRMASLDGPRTPTTVSSSSASMLSSAASSASTFSSYNIPLKVPQSHQRISTPSDQTDDSEPISARGGDRDSTHSLSRNRNRSYCDTTPKMPIRIRSIRSVASIQEEPHRELQSARASENRLTYTRSSGTSSDTSVLPSVDNAPNKHYSSVFPLPPRLSTIESVGLMSERSLYEDDEDDDDHNEGGELHAGSHHSSKNASPSLLPVSIPSAASKGNVEVLTSEMGHSE